MMTAAAAVPKKKGLQPSRKCQTATTAPTGVPFAGQKKDASTAQGRARRDHSIFLVVLRVCALPRSNVVRSVEAARN